MRSNFKALVVILVMPVMAVASGVTEAGEVPVAQTRNISVVSGNRVRFSMPAIGQEMLKNPSMMVVDIGHQKIGEENWTLLLQCIQHRETATFQCSENDSSSSAITVGVWPTQTVLTIKNATHQHSGIYKMVFTYASNLPREVEVNLAVTEADQEQATAEQTKQQSVVPSPKKLQSKSDIQAPAAVLPEICLICKKKAHYITAKGKGVKDKLAKAKTESCGRLREAAELKCDESILIHIRNKDWVHASNYRADHLKARIKSDYPQITFHRPSTRNESELLYVETLSTGVVYEELHSTSESELTSSETESGWRMFHKTLLLHVIKYELQ